MPDIAGQAVLDVVIGVAFFYFLLSIVCSSISEAFATTLNLRARNLEEGVRKLLADPGAAQQFYGHWRVQTLFKPPRKLDRFLSPGLKDKRPSYIPPRVFALTLLDTFAPPRGNRAGSRDLLARARRAVKDTDNETIKGLLQDALDEARDDVDKLRGALERSYDETMERVSGWYKRRIQLVLFVIALVLVAAMNADSFVVAQRLWKDDALRTAVVQQATATVDDQTAECARGDDGAADLTPAEIAANCVDEVEQLGIPLGWTAVPSGWGIPAKIGGLLVTVFAVMLGAPFWFDLLGKVARLRGTGAAPATSQPASATAPSAPAAERAEGTGEERTREEG